MGAEWSKEGREKRNELLRHQFRCIGDQTILSLRGDNFDKEDMETIAQELARNTTLEILDLSMTCMGNEGVEALADALRKNTTLQTLCLTDN